MSRLFNIKHSKAHRAHDDALATAQLLIIYLNVFIDKGIKKVNQLYYPRNKFELDRIHFDQDEGEDSVLNLLKDMKTPTLITIKGERGLILAVIPLQRPDEETRFVQEILNDLDWKLVTIRLIKPLIEGIFQFNNHFSKYPEETREKILKYLNTRYLRENQDDSPEESVSIDKIDFLISHHLVADQLIVYSFLNLNTNTKPIFKIPAQKKKMYQHLIGQINRYENQQKGRKKHLLHAEIIPLIETYINSNKGQNKHLFLSRKDIKENKDYVFKTIEEFSRKDKNEANFPTQHL